MSDTQDHVQQEAIAWTPEQAKANRAVEELFADDDVTGGYK